MLKHIVGLLRPDAGEVYFDGRRIDNLRERDLISVRLQIVLQNTVGALGRIATEISRSGTNIERVNMEEKRPGLYTTIHFTVQVASRTSLARLMRSVRRLPEVVRIARDQGLTA